MPTYWLLLQLIPVFDPINGVLVSKSSTFQLHSTTALLYQSYMIIRATLFFIFFKCYFKCLDTTICVQNHKNMVPFTAPGWYWVKEEEKSFKLPTDTMFSC